RGLMVYLLFSLKRSYVILLLEHWIKVFLFPSGSNYSQPPVFPGLRLWRAHRLGYRAEERVVVKEFRQRRGASETAYWRQVTEIREIELRMIKWLSIVKSPSHA